MERVVAFAVLFALIGASSALGRTLPTCFGYPATIVGTPSYDHIRGTGGDDVIVSLGGSDTIRGLTGDDRICSGGSADVVKAGYGDDHVDLGRGSYELDIARGGIGRDRLVGSLGGEIGSVLFGGRDDDRLIARGHTVARFRGGRDDDRLNASHGYAWAVYASATDPVFVNLWARTAHGAGHDRLFGVDGIKGSRYGDTLIGNGEPNYIWGSGGDDVIGGAGGRDSLEGDSGYDSIHGGGGRDRCTEADPTRAVAYGWFFFSGTRFGLSPC